MDKNLLIRGVEKILDLEPLTLVGDEEIVKLPNWDSLVFLELLSMIEKEYGTILNVEAMIECKTLDELFGLINETAN